jgi:hypothetical protein
MENFKHTPNGLICPWCPQGKVTVLIQNCGHNPFKLMAEVRRLQAEVDKDSRARHILEDLGEYLNGNSN